MEIFDWSHLQNMEMAISMKWIYYCPLQLDLHLYHAQTITSNTHKSNRFDFLCHPIVLNFFLVLTLLMVDVIHFTIVGNSWMCWYTYLFALEVDTHPPLCHLCLLLRQNRITNLLQSRILAKIQMYCIFKVTFWHKQSQHKI